MTNKNKAPAFMPAHPGCIFKSGFVEEYNFDVSTTAKMLDITREHLSRVMNGHIPITSKLALKLEALTGTPARQWLAMQENYDHYFADQNENFVAYKEALSGWREKYLEASPKERTGSYGVIVGLAKKAFGKEGRTA
jgi:addiction module HigA family antidote